MSESSREEHLEIEFEPNRDLEMDAVIDFPPSKSPQETIFAAQAHFENVANQANQAFAKIIKENTEARELSWWESLTGREQPFEDKLADLVIVLLKADPGNWSFLSENPPQAKYSQMRVIINFPSASGVRFQIRTIDDKISYSGIKASRAKRKEIYNTIQRAREHKILAAITKEAEKQVFAITDQRDKK